MTSRDRKFDCKLSLVVKSWNLLDEARGRVLAKQKI